MNITTLGIDLAKNVFELYEVDGQGKKVLSKRLTRGKLAKFIAQLPLFSHREWNPLFPLVSIKLKLLV